MAVFAAIAIMVYNSQMASRKTPRVAQSHVYSEAEPRFEPRQSTPKLRVLTTELTALVTLEHSGQRSSEVLKD